jgi:Arsenite efflux pump ACR3 and related permeases
MRKVSGPSTAWILLGVLGGALLGIYAPWESQILVVGQWVALALMVFLVVVSLPLLSVGRAIAKPRVLVALFAVNLVVVPLVAFILSRVVFQVPELQVGLLLVLLAPGVALSLTTAHEAGGDVESVLGAKPLLFAGQLVIVPLYTVFLSGGVLGFADLPPTFVVIGGIIVAPSVVALALQWGMARSATLQRTRTPLTHARVPVIALAVALVLWNQVPAHLEELEELYRVVPLFFSFLVLLAPLGLFAGILAGLTIPEKRAIMIVGAGRGGVIMLPISLALDQDIWGLVPLVVITQLTLEVLGMMVYRTIVPELVPSDSR